MSISPMSADQAKALVDARQIFESYEAATRRLNDLAGSLRWKTVNGNKYLVRGYTGGKTVSLGPYDKKTIELKDKFERDKTAATEARKNAVDSVSLHAGFIKVVGLARVPLSGAKVIRALQKKGVPHKIVGTNAMYAYEVAGGILFEPGHLATDDMDVLLDSRQTLKIVAALDQDSLLGLIKKTDRTFAPMSDSPYEFSAVNNNQYRIDFITQGGDALQQSDFERQLNSDDLQPVAIDSLKWILSAPTFEQVVFDTKGMPLRINAVDPRAFVLHKWFVSNQPDRDRVKAIRDEAQARVVATALKNHLPQLPYAKAIGKIFPHYLQKDVRQGIGDFDL